MTRAEAQYRQRPRIESVPVRPKPVPIENVPLPKFKDQSEAQACALDFHNRAKAYVYRAEAARLQSSRRAS